MQSFYFQDGVYIILPYLEINYSSNAILSILIIFDLSTNIRPNNELFRELFFVWKMNY